MSMFYNHIYLYVPTLVLVADGSYFHEVGRCSRRMASLEEDLDEGGLFLASIKGGRTHLKKGAFSQKR